MRIFRTQGNRQARTRARVHHEGHDRCHAAAIQQQPHRQRRLERSVTKQDIELYATVSGDANPTHLDEAFAKQAKFKGTVAHSMLSAGLISSVLGNRLPGAGTVYLAQELRFAAPVYADDRITVTVTASEKRSAERIVRFDCTCVNQDGQTVLDLTISPPSRIPICCWRSRSGWWK